MHINEFCIYKYFYFPLMCLVLTGLKSVVPDFVFCCPQDFFVERNFSRTHFQSSLIPYSTNNLLFTKSDLAVSFFWFLYSKRKYLFVTTFRSKIISAMEKTLPVVVNAVPMNRKAFDELLLRKMYVVPSFEIHQGPAGFMDYGPPACALKANILNLWRQHFVVEDQMLEMECTNLTPSNVLEASGHVERFTDFMVRDEKTGESFRADKLLEDAIESLIEKEGKNMTDAERDAHLVVGRSADAYDAEELHAMLVKYKVKSPSLNKEKNSPGNDLTKPFPFNLMFKTTIGPEGTSVGFLRPETAQGLFVNFKRLLDYNQQKMPFAGAQIGTGFRNEISPRGGLLRVREFCMAEIEHFVNPDEKAKHIRFKNVKDVVVTLFTAPSQLSTGEMISTTIGEAVANGIILNESIGYFMGRSQLFFEKIGVDPTRMRLRQHMSTEMAHYAADCWDMEVLLHCGWTECAGHSDRACYDLQAHAKATGHSMFAAARLPEPIVVDKVTCEPNKKKLGPLFKANQKAVITLLEAMEGDELDNFRAELDANGKAVIPNTDYAITSDLVTFKTTKKTVEEVKFLPSVIEPSYGIGRVITAVMEHAFTQRENDENRCVMNFRPEIAPIKVGIFRLINNPDFDPIVEEINRMLAMRDLVTKVDSSSGTVGRRYARADELGIPFGITVDFQSLADNAVTVRDRETMAQIRVPIAHVGDVIQHLVRSPPTDSYMVNSAAAYPKMTFEYMEMHKNWSYYMSKYPVVSTGDSDEAKEETNSNTKVERTLRGSFTRPI